MNKPVLLSFVGPSNSGKTTLISRLIPVFRKQGLRVATIKNASRGFTMDHPGKDTYVHKQAGAAAVMIVSPEKVAMVADRLDQAGPEELARTHLSFADLVLVEGFKFSALPKIWVFGRNVESSRPSPEVGGIVAVVGGTGECANGVPSFSPEDIDGLADFITEKFLGARAGGGTIP